MSHESLVFFMPLTEGLLVSVQFKLCLDLLLNRLQLLSYCEVVIELTLDCPSMRELCEKQVKKFDESCLPVAKLHNSIFAKAALVFLMLLLELTNLVVRILLAEAIILSGVLHHGFLMMDTTIEQLFRLILWRNIVFAALDLWD